SSSTGNPSLSYNWDNGLGSGVSQSVSPTITTIYTVTVTDGNSCTDTDAIVITVNSTPTIDAVNIVPIASCNPPFDGVITITASGSTPLSYSINGGSTFQSNNIFDSLNVGVYNIVVINLITTCSAILDTVITLNSATGPSVDSVQTTDVTCYGDTTGQLIIYAIGATQYSINGIDYFTDSTFTGLNAGTYNVIVMDAGNCQDIYSATINEPAELLINFTDSTSILCYGDNNGSITVTPSGGTPGYTYFWDGGVTPTDSVATGLSDGTYTVVVTDNHSCTNSLVFSLSNPAQIQTSFVATDVLCYGDSTGEAVVTSSGGTGTHTYQWTNSILNDTITALIANTNYYLTVTDENGCIKIDTIVVNQPDSLNLSVYTNDATCSGSDGIAIVTVTGGFPNPDYFYNWENNYGTTISVNDTVNYLSYGTYYLTVTDGNNCKDSLNVQILSHVGGEISITNIVDVLCYGDNDGEIVITVLNGTPNYTFEWSNGDSLTTIASTDTISNLASGNYIITVTDLNNCVAIDTITVQGPDTILQVTTPVQHVLCYGGASGAIIALGSGGTSPYNYLWNTGDTTSTLTNLFSGSYSLTVTDNNDCSFTLTKIYVEEPDMLIIDEFTIIEPLCYGKTTGSIELTVAGGTRPYIYLWSDGGTDSLLTGIGSGTYDVLITDINNCNLNDTFIVSEAIQLIVTDTVFIENNLGSINITVSGGILPYTYLWNDNNNTSTEDIAGLMSGDYVITITDGNQCIYINTVTVDIPIKIPTLFTPNGDGFNDTWYIRGIGSYPELSIEIFNRWGDHVYTYEGTGSEYLFNTGIQWDGTYNGNLLPMGSYLYILDLKNGQNPYNGVVSIKR
ncbi:MAG: gliding motility-associated C-terminal domain-containing protein, partial [Bacteroidota bacterium]